MLKFLGCLVVALGAVLSIPMEMTTMRPEATTEDTSGRLLSLPDPVKCAQSESTLLVWIFSFIIPDIILTTKATYHTIDSIKDLLTKVIGFNPKWSGGEEWTQKSEYGAFLMGGCRGSAVSRNVSRSEMEYWVTPSRIDFCETTPLPPPPIHW